mmetsp:Transcript_3177/g.12768  ORF Transcript_3177/g.12768 Transcript_3177/m.12768 type:complete len:249 (+) Transcript_3177:647-1393(+)
MPERDGAERQELPDRRRPDRQDDGRTRGGLPGHSRHGSAEESGGLRDASGERQDQHLRLRPGGVHDGGEEHRPAPHGGGSPELHQERGEEDGGRHPRHRGERHEGDRLQRNHQRHGHALPREVQDHGAQGALQVGAAPALRHVQCHGHGEARRRHRRGAGLLRPGGDAGSRRSPGVRVRAGEGGDPRLHHHAALVHGPHAERSRKGRRGRDQLCEDRVQGQPASVRGRRLGHGACAAGPDLRRRADRP